MIELKDVLHGQKGDLDAWLECQSEDEVRDAILALCSGSLRDEFAGRAMAAMISNPNVDGEQAGAVVTAAYQYADAMLAARAK